MVCIHYVGVLRYWIIPSVLHLACQKEKATLVITGTEVPPRAFGGSMIEPWAMCDRPKWCVTAETVAS